MPSTETEGISVCTRCMLRALIDQNSSEPIVGMEYVYSHTMMWLANDNASSHISVQPGFIVHQVKLITDKAGWHMGYHFLIKGDNTGTMYSCNYAWAFAEHTEDNLLRIEEFNKADKEWELAGRKRRRALRAIHSLQIYTKAAISQ
jgi:hypothetical protein